MAKSGLAVEEYSLLELSALQMYKIMSGDMDTGKLIVDGVNLRYYLGMTIKCECYSALCC